MIEIAGIDETRDFFRKAFEQTIARLGIAAQTHILAPGETPKPDSIVVAVGNTATRTITNDFSLRVEDCHSYSLLCGGRVVIPCLDYRSVFKDGLNTHWLEWSLRKAKLFDKKAAVIDTFPHTILKPRLEEVSSFINSIGSDPISIDIECVPETCEITSIAFAKSPLEVICIPLATKNLENYWAEEEELVVWHWIQHVLYLPNKKIFQNFIFDTMMLRYHGIETKTNIIDTMVIASALNPLLPKGLRDLGRVYLNCAPWKDTKDYKLTGDIESFWRYNALDASRTYQISNKLLLELEETDRLEHYTNYIEPLYALVYDTCVRGIRIDETRLDELKYELEKELLPIKAILSEIGDPLVEKKKIKKKLRDKENDKGEEKAYKEVIEEIAQAFNPNSDKQIKSVLVALGYRIPIKYGKESTNRESLLKLNRKQPHRFIENLLPYNRLSKIKSTYASLLLDEDKRLRFTYNIAGTISGRFSAQKTNWDTGLNIITIPRTSDKPALDVKNIFIPDEGKILLEVDLSQAELRVVAWLANETKLIELMENNEDVHQYTADRISEYSGLICPRQLGKRINHASSYGMGAEKFADSCLIEADLSISVSDARKLLEARSRTFPAISVWQKAIESELARTRKLTSPLGRSAFFYGPLSPDMIRQGLSFIPQATVVDTINRSWILLSKDKAYNRVFNVLAQVHDSLLLQVATNELKNIIDLVNFTFAQQHCVINGIKRIIPHEISIGKRWGTVEELV